jgi:hypothetical protein
MTEGKKPLEITYAEMDGIAEAPWVEMDRIASETIAREEIITLGKVAGRDRVRDVIRDALRGAADLQKPTKKR